MGVAGSGKSTVGRARRRPSSACRSSTATTSTTAPASSAMRQGIPLDDAARGPWLDRLHAVLDAHRATGAVLACSALTAAYRARLAPVTSTSASCCSTSPGRCSRTGCAGARDHFAGVDLLASQLATLERGPDVVAVDADRPTHRGRRRRRRRGRPAPPLGSGADGRRAREATAWSWCWCCSRSWSLAAAAVLAMVSVRRSTLRITADGVEYRNYPQATQVVPLAQVAPLRGGRGGRQLLRPAAGDGGARAHRRLAPAGPEPVGSRRGRRRRRAQRARRGASRPAADAPRR